jgi:5'-nucleotidase
MERPLILLTNDDGIDSPGLAALAAGLDPVADLLIVAPREQQSGMGRSLPKENDGRLFKTTVRYGEQTWEGYAAHASPAQAVQHAILELSISTARRIDLAISGINYGENVGTGVTISGTVGAALEASALGVLAMAVSLEVEPGLHLSNSDQVDFGVAAHFARLFAERWLAVPRPSDVDVLKIEVPANATPDTPWRITRVETEHYYIPVAYPRTSWEAAGQIGYTKVSELPANPNTDAGAVVRGFVSVTPLSLDLTSRVDFGDLADLLKDGK